MLDERDVRVISGLLDTRFAAFEDKIEQKIDARFEAFEKKMDDTFTTFATHFNQQLERTEKKIISSVGEMLEQNVFPQFDVIHRELHRINAVMGLQP